MTTRPAFAILALLALGPVARAQAPREIAITARRYAYDPPVVRLKRGERVTLVLTALDVAHGLLCRPLKLKADLQPGVPVRVPLEPREAGTFVAICNHFCGPGHSEMRMTFIVEGDAGVP
jgi:cytochrome c oxidase subunit 2